MNNWIDTANGREGTAYKQGLEEGRREARAELEPVLREIESELYFYADKFKYRYGTIELDEGTNAKKALAKLRTVLKEEK